MAPFWIPYPVVLRGPRFELRPLEPDDLDSLFEASSNPRIWELTSVDYSNPEIFYPNFEAALRDRDAGKCYPFLIVDRAASKTIGTTRLLDIFPADRRLEIGVTWLDPEYWGTGANMECKFLLLRFCFEELSAVRVQFRAKANNARSRAALEKIGAKFEGVLRKDRIEPGGTARNTAFYSIIDEEWPAAKAALEKRLKEKYAAA
ncbi:MAG TPA: GNAT family N-acetyltransferase [Rhodanobacteraceae bacterium]|nr:GNAT family N-acetyltransferase [Rhodanobacteraceae bacterium]